MTVLLGVLLGWLSRVEEVTAGFSIGLSSDTAWITAAFVAGLRQDGGRRAALAGTAVLTIANATYYAVVALEEPGVELASLAGRPTAWIVLGIAGGALYGAAGWAWRRGDAPVRVGASLLLAGVLIADGAVGPPTDRISLVLGVVLPVLSAPARLRVPAGVASAAIAVIALQGVLEPALP